MPDLVSDLVSDEDTILPECIINAGIWCREVFDSVWTWCVERCTRVSNWCQEKHLKYERELTIVLKSTGIVLYILDLMTDTFTSVKYFSNGKRIAGSVTVIFTILPMLFLSSKLIIHSSVENQNSIDIKFLPSAAAIVCSPILPLGWLVLDLVTSISLDNSNSNNGYSIAISESTRSTAAKAARIVKLFVAVVESFPQSTIQLFIVFGSLVAGETVEVWQWVSIAVSLISLSYSVSTGHLNAQAASSSKAIYFIFGLLSLCSRQAVCCVYSIHYAVLWLMPFCTQLATSIIIWSISSKCQGHWAGLLIFVLTEAYNCFSISGLLTSSLYLCFAVGAFFLFEVRQEAHHVFDKLLIVTVELASISLAFNFLFTVIPQFKGVRMDWMKNHGTGITQPDTEGTSTFAMETRSDAEGDFPSVTETQPNAEEVLTDATETNHGVGTELPYGPETQRVAEGVFTYATENQPDGKGVLTYGFESQPNVERALTSFTKSQPGAKEVLIFSSETQSDAEEVLSYDTEAPFVAINTDTNVYTTKDSDKQLFIDGKITIHDTTDSLKMFKESKTHDNENPFDAEKSSLDTMETKADSKETASDIEETYF